MAVILAGMTGTGTLRAEELGGHLECRRIQNNRLPEEGVHIPREIVQVFLYEGAPRSVKVGEKHIAVDYGKSGCLFDRSTSRLVKRFTIADGWPATRPDTFHPERRWWRGNELVGPGVLHRWRGHGDEVPEVEVVAEVAFGGKTWRAVQPAGFLRALGRSMSWKERREKFGTWTTILEMLNKASYVETVGDTTEQSHRHSVREGLAGNIVTHLATADGTLWAASVDIYDRDKEAWGPGGLSRFNVDSNRWERIEFIDGHPVRWVTLLQTIGDELWVGFREGSGVEGDKVVYGMGLYPGRYRPKTTAIVLARLREGKWQTYSRAPRSERSRSRYGVEPVKPPPSTEKPVSLGVSGEQVVLLTQTGSIRLSGNWDVEKDGHVSLLDLPSGKWTDFDAEKDLDADQLDHFVCDNGEIIVTSNRGVHRWDARRKTWGFLDSQCHLKNPALSAATPAGDMLWVGYMNQSFGVVGRQGISRYDEKTGKWSYTTPGTLRTHCPVKRIATIGDGDVWVLFGQRPNLGAACEFRYYERESRPMPDGVARYAAGKWEFPAKMEGVPPSIERERKGTNGPERWTEKVRMGGLATVGSHVFVSTTAGVFMGPDPWKRILKPSDDRRSFFDCGDHIETSQDGECVVIVRRDPKDHQSVLRARFVPPEGEIRFDKIKLRESTWHLPHRGYLLNQTEQGRWGQDWAVVPSSVCEEKWVVGPFGGTGYRSVVETAAGIWFASNGELVRLDRHKLSEWVRKQTM